MARKTTGSASPRIKKTNAPAEPMAVAPSIPQTSLEVPKIALVAGNGEKKVGVALDDEIRYRAYELYLERNGAAGDPNRDWFVAEREVRARHAAAGHSA